MGVFTGFYNLMYALNPLPERHFQEEQQQNMPSLPDLAEHYSKRNMFGSAKYVLDPRFSQSTHDVVKKCMYNFAVWRQCLTEKTTDQSMDEEDVNASICKKYKRLARMTCHGLWWKRYMEMIEKESYMGIPALNTQRVGSNPNILYVDDHYNIVQVFNQYENGKKKYHVGQSLHGEEGHH